MRGLIPVVLGAAAVLYWLWPYDLIPDASRYGYIDDGIFTLSLGVLAGRLTMHKPRPPRRRSGRLSFF